MNNMYLTVDGMLSGTGVRNTLGGGYVKISDLNLSLNLSERIKNWVSRYEEAHYSEFSNENEVDTLDKEGLNICKQMREELPKSKIEYYSHARSIKL